MILGSYPDWANSTSKYSDLLPGRKCLPGHSLLQHVAVCYSMAHCITMHYIVLNCVSMCFIALHYVTLC